MGQNVKALLQEAQRPTRTFRLCLRGDLQAQWDALDARLQETTHRGAASLEGNGRVGLAREMEQLREQMEGATLTLTLRALRHDEYRRLEQDHPPRPIPKKPPTPSDDDDADQAAADEHARKVEDANQDKLVGVNAATFYEALVQASTIDPDLDRADWERLFNAISNRQYDDLAGTAFALNRGEVSVPFSPTASRLARISSPS